MNLAQMVNAQVEGTRETDSPVLYRNAKEEKGRRYQEGAG